MADTLFFGGGEQVRFLLHHGQNGLPNVGAYAVVIDAGEGLEVDALQQLTVQGEFQFLVFGLEFGIRRRTSRALFPARFDGSRRAGRRHLVACWWEKTSTFLTAPR